MVCDEQRPCSRCVKRSIGHLCHDETTVDSTATEGGMNQNSAQETDVGASVSGPEQHLDIQPVPDHLAQVLPEEPEHSGNHQQPNVGGVSSSVSRHAHTDSQLIDAGVNNVNPMGQSNVSHALSGVSLGRISSLNQPLFLSEHIGSEFSSLNEFLTMLEDPMLIEPGSPIPQQMTHQDVDPSTNGHFNSQPAQLQGNIASEANHNDSLSSTQLNSTTVHPRSDARSHPMISPHLLPDDQQPTPKENFFLTAADPSTEINPEDRLKLVINAKLEAGLLQPYNYAKGYSRLQNFMDKYMNQSSKQRILKPLSIIRPAFRAIARSLKDVDLVLVEESFERMLLSYDRVFTSMSMPACLWRRTGEIYRGNKEFASLVDCKVDDLRDGKLAIYELMSEESAVNFWEKYGSIAFDKGQKAVLTSCNLRTRDGRQRRPCCFSFTIRRDRYNIPICIVGNFIPIS